MSAARVVVTGLGAVSPLGLTAQDLWAGLSAGRCGFGRIRAFDPTGFPSELAGEVPEYRIQDRVPRSCRKAVKLMCRDIELAVMAAGEAIASSGLVTKGIDPEKVNVDPTRLAINVGAGIICCDLPELAPATMVSVTDGRFDLRKWGKDGLDLVTPLWLLKYLPNMLACHIGIIHDIQGPSNTITCGEASGQLAIGEAAHSHRPRRRRRGGRRGGGGQSQPVGDGPPAPAPACRLHPRRRPGQDLPAVRRERLRIDLQRRSRHDRAGEFGARPGAEGPDSGGGRRSGLQPQHVPRLRQAGTGRPEHPDRRRESDGRRRDPPGGH